MLIGAALSASTVAPAQVLPTAEPLDATAAPTPTTVADHPLTQTGEFEAPAEFPVPSEPTVEQAVEEPAVKPSGSLSEMVAQFRSSDPGDRQLECLAVGIYFESKSEPLVGQLAVGEVIANRANSNGRFPSSYCGVLFQRSQFSFIRGRSLPSVPRSSKQWSTAVAIAKIVHQDLKDSGAPKALLFHARRVSPGWKLKRVASIGNHIFYR